MSDVAPLVRVTDVQVLSRYIVDLEFADGMRKVIDLEPHLWGEMFAPLLDDYALFRRVHVDGRAGTIVWPNGADLSPRMLYEQAKVSVPS